MNRNLYLFLVIPLIFAIVLIPSVYAAVPVIESSTNDKSGTSDVTSLQMEKPTGVATDDLLMLIMMNEDQGATNPFDDITGWTTQMTGGNAASDSKYAIFWRIADGTEPTHVNVTTGSNADIIGGFYLRISGANLTVPFNVEGTPVAEQSGDNRIIASVTTTTDDTLAFGILVFDGVDGSPLVVQDVNNWLQWNSMNSGSGGNGFASIIINKSLGTAGATGDANISVSANDGSIRVQWAIASPAVAGGTETTLGINQLLNIIALQSNDVDFIRDNEQRLTLTPLANRDRATFGFVTQPLTATSLVGRTVVLFRQITQPFTLTPLTDIDAPIRVLITQFLTIGDVSDSIVFQNEGVNQPLTIDPLTDRIRTAFGIVTQPLTLDSLVDRTAMLIRNLVQRLLLTPLTDIDAPLRVLITQFLTMGDETVRILFHTEDVDQPLILSPLTDRIRDTFGEITQPITIDSVVDRTTALIRNIVQRLLIDPVTQIITIGQTLINIIQQLILTPLTDPTAVFGRDVDQPLTINPLSDRTRTVFSEITQPLNINLVVDRTVAFIRNLVQRLLLNPVTQVATAGQTLINILQQLIITPLIDPTGAFDRGVDQPLTIDPLANRIRTAFGEVVQPLNIQDIVDRTASLIRNIDQRILLTPLTQIGVVSETLINIIQQLILNPLADTTAAFDRGLTQPFTLGSIVDRTRDTFASITQSLSLNSIADRVTVLIRNIVQRLLLFGGLVSGIDDVVPTIMIVFPEDNTLHEGIVIDFLLNVSEPIDNWIYTFDQGITNSTPLIFNDTSLRIVFGNTSTYNVSVYGFDEAGNSDNDQVIISLIRRLTTAFIMYLFLVLLAICCLIFGNRMDRPILITTSGILFIVVGLGFGVSGILDIQNVFINRVAAYTIAGIGAYLVVAEPLEQYLRREKE